MRKLLSLFVIIFLAVSASIFARAAHPVATSWDPCDGYGDCVSSSISYIRSNPDGSLYLGDQFRVLLSVQPGSGESSGMSWSGQLTGTTWSYDNTAFHANATESSADFIVVANATASYSITATASFLVTITTCTTTTSSNGQTTTNCSTSYAETSVPVTVQVSLRAFVLALQTKLVNATTSPRQPMRNPDGTFYPDDSFCDSWKATFQFSSQRTDIRINVTSVVPPSLRILNYSAGALGRTGRFCYVVETTGSAFRPYQVALVARALNWQGVSLALRESEQPFAVVQYDPKFTSFAYMLYRNSTVSSSLRRPWVLFVRYDGNDPGYSYAGDNNTRPFNGSRTLAQRAYFSGFEFSTLSYQPFTTAEGGVFDFHVVNSTGTIQYDWLNWKDSAPLYYGNPIEKYVFNATASSLSPLLAQGFVYQNVTMVGCWQRENTCDLRQNYWLVPFLWNGRVNIVSVDSNGNLVQNAPISLTIENSSPLDGWLIPNFKHVFGDDPRALRAYEADLYPTNQTMTFNGTGGLSLLLNQTGLVPPQISITAGGVSLSGNFTFVPIFVNRTIMSVPNSLKGTVFYANATIPLWSYNMAIGELAYLPVSTTLDYPSSSFLELLNSSGWVVGNTTAPQTPSAFASQAYGFWPMGENLTVYANLQGGGVKLLGVHRVGSSQYQATFHIEPWSGGISSVQLVEGGATLPPQSTLNASAYPSPVLTALTGVYSIMYPASGQETKVVFTNLWGATTVVNLGTATAGNSLIDLVPVTTAAAFGIAFLAWVVASGILKTRKASAHE